MGQGNGRKAALHNLGCKVNAYETEAMQQMLEEAGYEIVPFDSAADVYVINTCSVTNMADRKSRQMLHRAKKRNPHGVVVAVGCYVQTAREKTHLAVDADILLGNDRKQSLVPALEEFFSTALPREELTDVGHPEGYETLQISKTREHTRAFVKVQDGCNQFCSYCIIPYARGRIRSRELSDVAAELKRLGAGGIREVVLTGIHLSSYGVDLPPDPVTGKEAGLLDLIRMAAGVEGIARIRLGSLEPGIVTEEFAGALAQIPQICPHFHLSLQSGCDSVLRRMNRRYDTQTFRERCALLRKYFPDPALTTDVIVGFPQETAEEFAATAAFLQEIGFYETHIFKYSPRAGTRAAKMEGQVSEAVKTERSNQLIALGEQQRLAYEKRRIGQRCQVLFEEALTLHGVRCWVGHTKEYIKVCMIPAQEAAGEDYTNRVLSGVLISPLSPGEHCGFVCCEE